MKQKQGLVGHALRVLSISILVAAQWVAAPVVHAGVKPQIVAAVQHGLALKSDGTVWTWGSNTFGELGDGTFTIRPSPVLVSGLSCVTAIAASGSHGLAVRCDGTVWAWGANHVGQLGLSQQNGALPGYPAPRQVLGIGGVVAVVAVEGQSFALKSDGSVWSWGSDAGVRRVLLPSSVVSISSQFRHALALLSDGTVWGWGHMQFGELGVPWNGNPSVVVASAPIPVPGLDDVIAIQAGSDMSWAVKSDGSLWAFGFWGYGGLGVGGQVNVGTSFASRSSPAQVPNISGVTSVWPTGSQTYALQSDGTLWGWGSGPITPLVSPVPSSLSSLAPFRMLSGDFNLRLALKGDGTVLSWGTNSVGELGNGTTQYCECNTPAPVKDLLLGSKHPPGDDLVIDFGVGNGLWMWLNNLSWQQLHGVPARLVATADMDFNGRDDVVVDFGSPYGIWVWMNNSNWVPLHGTSARHIVRADMEGNGQDDVVIDFGPQYGIWVRMNNSNWIDLHGISAEHITAADMDNNGQDDLVIDFGPQYGIWVRMNNRDWVPLHGTSAKSITAADMDNNGQDDLVIDFGPQYGIWVRMNNRDWVPLHGTSALSVAAVDIDNNGMDDVVIDFGPQYGIWVRMNNANWVLLHGVSAQHITGADLDGNGQGDVIVDFGSAGGGIWARMNNSNWVQINGVGAASITAGQIDGN
ncbi:MAG: hypothetical protein IPI02_10050 [Sterolibacteriaceae bacterium]|nr:hypothetical protein [Sterolibacteriaceae bacterium]